jgi:hypothetical protein
LKALITYIKKTSDNSQRLKITNILISFKTDGRFVKLADFGLSKLQECEDQSNTRDVGTDKYIWLQKFILLENMAQNQTFLV